MAGAAVLAGIGLGLPAARQSRVAEQGQELDSKLKMADLAARTDAASQANRAAAVKDAYERLTNRAKDLGDLVNRNLQAVIENSPDPASTGVTDIVNYGREQLGQLVDMASQQLGKGAISKADILAEFDSKITLPQSAAQKGQAAGTKAAAEAEANPNAADFVSVQLPGAGAGVTQFRKNDPQLQNVLDGGGTIVTTPDSNPNIKIVEALDTQTNKPVFVLESQALASGGRYVPKPNGMSLKSDGKGGFEFTTGGATTGPNNAPGVGTTGTGLIDTQVLAATAGLSRLQRITETYRPEFLQTGTKLQVALLAGKEKLGANLSPEQKTLVTDFTKFRSDAVQNFNQYIKDQTGTALSPGEAERLGAALPVAGTSVWDGDSPTQFQAKLEETTRQLNMAAARLSYVRQHGMTINDVPLAEVPSLIKTRIGEIEGEIKKASPGLTADDLNAAVRAQTAREFGLLTNG